MPLINRPHAGIQNTYPFMLNSKGNYKESRKVEQDFITGCIHDLKSKAHETYCYAKWQVEELLKLYNDLLVIEVEDYFLVKKVRK